jgi:hypothetical protein
MNAHDTIQDFAEPLGMTMTADGFLPFPPWSGPDGNPDPHYAEFVEDCCEHCSCDDKPCDAVLAGGLCDSTNEIGEKPRRENAESTRDLKSGFSPPNC